MRQFGMTTTFLAAALCSAAFAGAPPESLWTASDVDFQAASDARFASPRVETPEKIEIRLSPGAWLDGSFVLSRGQPAIMCLLMKGKGKYKDDLAELERQDRASRRGKQPAYRLLFEFDLPEGVSIAYGGLTEVNNLIVPQILWSVVAALAVMLVLLLYHFGKIGLALLALSSASLCVFGAMLGLWIFQLDISITAVLGVVSLIGIIVRNAIMMYEYAEDCRKYQQLSYRDAAFKSGIRRMRPVFLTSATTALGVLPMIIAHTSLWMPMGVVICFGTIFTLPLTVTILPVVYWKVYARRDI